MKKNKDWLDIYKKTLYVISIVIILLIVVVFAIVSKQNFNIYTGDIENNEDDFINYSVSSNYTKPKLAIIIDDFGQNRDGVKEMMEIGRPMTFAIMPFLTYTKADANKAHEKGFEVIVHLPMQSQDRDIASWLGPRPIKLGQSNNEIRRIVLDSFRVVPHAVGANIHMGTKSSEDPRVMSCVMKNMEEKNLYFVDSMTSSKSVCREVAKDIKINFVERNYFLEQSSIKTMAYARQQLLTAGELAVKKGYAVVIGHVGSAGGRTTARAIKETIPQLEKMGIQLVQVSKLFRQLSGK
ncbi:MAG TPA: divergent polysaccharide deacetylase family protein [Clostridiales bacterium]|nr:divergent polysaccharide deacetylase family protein [Clostridiales bacterium]